MTSAETGCILIIPFCTKKNIVFWDKHVALARLRQCHNSQGEVIVLKNTAEKGKKKTVRAVKTIAVKPTKRQLQAMETNNTIYKAAI